MRGGSGILGSGGAAHKKQRQEQEKRRRERWLVALGVALHAIYMLSIFDIYFKSPIVHGMDPVPQRISPPPANRLVLIIADGLRADKFFEPDSDGKFRAPFLRSVILEKGRWGVSHARPPTESRPGHVSIIAGFYEDPSAVTKGWKANPVEFDSVFNRSRHTISYGSPDIVPIFCGGLSHSTWGTYPHEFEDFASDASFLDQWSFDQFHSLLNRSYDDPKLRQLLFQDNLVVFLHLLGCDTNGHAHRPYSPIYLNNVKIVDQISESVYNLVESYFNDNRTAYIFTADHGMSDKGSHGDGHPTNTDTPLVVWGAGIKNPERLLHISQSDDGFRFVDDHKHHMPTPVDWDLTGIERVDVNQADIAPLMATLVGLPCPVNSVGNLPLGYLKLSKADEVEASLANTKQVLNQFLRKSYIKQSNSLHFKSFKPLSNYSSTLSHIEDLISARDFQAALKASENLRSLSLAGLHYFQTYDWFMLMTTVTLGYIGWMVNLILHVLRSYSALPSGFLLNNNQHLARGSTIGKVPVSLFILPCPRFWTGKSWWMFVDGLISFLLFLEKSPPLYHAYVFMTTFLWTQIFGNIQLFRTILRGISSRTFKSNMKLIAISTIAILILEFLVASFSERKLYTWCFVIVGVLASVFMISLIPNRPLMALIASGAIVVLIGMASRHFEFGSEGDKFRTYISQITKQDSRFPMLFLVQVLLVVLSSALVWLSTSHRIQNKELHTVHQLINWAIAGISMILPMLSPKGLLARLTSIFLGFAPPFLLLSIGYEAVFYGALALVLMGWILVECAILYKIEDKGSYLYIENLDDSHDERSLKLSHIRIPLTFMVLFNVAFFGTGNFASIASFEISSVYRFVTIFSPFIMAALLIFKLLIPFLLVICVFSAITKLIKIPRLGCYFVVILLSDVMTIHFFFLVRNTGSWMEIGNSISHFGIVSAQVVFVLLLFLLTNIYTKDIEIPTARPSRKKM